MQYTLQPHRTQLSDLYPGLDDIQGEDAGPEADPRHAAAHHRLHGPQLLRAHLPQAGHHTPDIQDLY